jgi:tetratricopeptide (TPR) repeat protein
MTSEQYKKWIIIALFLVVFGIGIFVLTRHYYKIEQPKDMREQRGVVTGPIRDSGTIAPLPFEKEGIDTESPEALARLGDRYFESSRFEQAAEIYKKVLKLNPNDVDTYNDLGLALHYSGKSDEGVEILQRGAAVNPFFQRIWLSLGFVLASLGKNEEAKPALQKAQEIDPDSEPGREAQRILGLLQ